MNRDVLSLFLEIFRAQGRKTTLLSDCCNEFLNECALSLSLCLSGQSTLLAKERFHFFSSPILGYYYLLLIMHSTSSCGLPHSVSLQNILLTTFAGLSTEFDSFAPNLQQIATCIAKLRQTCLLSVNIATELQVYTNFIANNNCKRFCRLLQLPNLPYQNLSIL